MRFKTNRHISSIKAYEPGRPLAQVAREYGLDHVVKLASNENPIGFSPRVNEAVLSTMKDMNRYPEASAPELTGKLADRYGVSTENIVLGNGSDDIIALLCHAYLNEGDEALMPLPSFLMYEISARTAKGVPVMVPLKGFTTNLDGLLEKISSKTRLVFLTNPFNPTGSTITCEQFEQFSSRVPENVIIVMDEAYIEFVRDDYVYNSLKDPLKDPRVVTLRTFSKAYGLAGFRIGYGVMEKEIAQILHKIRQPFNVNTLAQAAAAAALDDNEFLERAVAETHAGIDFLCSELEKLGYECLPTQSNFFMFDLKTDASKVFEEMLKFGVIVRSMKSYGFGTFLRVNTGTRQENLKFLDAVRKVLT